MKINSKVYKVLELGTSNKEIVIDDRYTLMIAANHISIMEDVDGDMVVADSTEDKMTDRQALKWALEVVEYMYNCEIDW